MRSPWFRHCQSCFVGLVLLVLAIGGTLLWKVNQTGFSGKWGQQLQEQLDAYGLHAEFSSTRLSFTKGLVSKDLKIYADEERTILLASTDRLYLDIDRSIALRGQWQVRSAIFENAFIHLPEQFAPHNLNALTGTATICRENCLTITDTTGRLGQLDIALNASLTMAPPNQAPEEEQPEDEDPPLYDFLAILHQEISKWSSSSTQSPKLSLNIEGNLTRSSTLSGHFQFQAPHITRLGYEMDDLLLAGRINQSSLLFDQMSFHDSSGPFSGNAHYDFLRRTANFEVTSQANLQKLLRLGLNINKLEKMSFTSSPQISTKGELHFPYDGGPQLNLTGHLAVQDFRLLGGSWSSLSSDFSWQDGKLYLRDFLLSHPEGTLTGKLLFQDENIRYQARSTLPAQLFDPFIAPDSDIRNTLSQAKFTEDSRITIDLSGNIRPSDLTDWTAMGTLLLENFSYNGVPAHYASADFNLTPLQSVYTSPEIEFDLTEDPSFRYFGGTERAIVRADLISYDDAEGLTRIEHLHGVCWPAPVLRLFIPDTAGYLERTYRMSEPPAFSSTGVIDHLAGQNRTSFHTRISLDAPLFYDFLGQPIELRETEALIHTHHSQIDVTDLSSYAFSGPIAGELSILLPNSEDLNPDFRGSLRWTRLKLADIGESYHFGKIKKGLLTGRLDFSGTSEKIETLTGTGNIGLEKGELFKAPVFGPLSPLIAGIQGHSRASHEIARDASAKFLINKGILYTDDFITSTDSLTVKAEGSIDIARQTLNMTARADTEGLLKLVTLPLNLAGLSGLFQFHGTGSITEPKWENTPFTRPKKKKRAPLFQPPPRAQIVPE